MTFWEWFTVTGTTATIMGVFLTVYGILNGRSTRRLLRAMHEDTMRVLERMDATLRRVDETIRRVDETIRRVDETVRRLDETIRRMDDTLRHIADLVVAEGERTRRAIRGEPP